MVATLLFGSYNVLGGQYGVAIQLLKFRVLKIWAVSRALLRCSGCYQGVAMQLIRCCYAVT